MARTIVYLLMNKCWTNTWQSFSSGSNWLKLINWEWLVKKQPQNELEEENWSQVVGKKNFRIGLQKFEKNRDLDLKKIISLIWFVSGSRTGFFLSMNVKIFCQNRFLFEVGLNNEWRTERKFILRMDGPPLYGWTVLQKMVQDGWWLDIDTPGNVANTWAGSRRFVSVNFFGAWTSRQTFSLFQSIWSKSKHTNLWCPISRHFN